MASSRRFAVAFFRPIWSSPFRTFFSSSLPHPSSSSSSCFSSGSSSIRPSSPLPRALSPPAPTLCGRGDKKTKKGKRFRGKFGNSRPNREHRIRRIRERWEQPPGTPWPVPGLSVENYYPII